MVTGSANVGIAHGKWFDEFMPENTFFWRFMRELAEQIVKPMKMSRWGAGLRLLGMLILQYQDMLSDIYVMREFYEQEQYGAFKKSLFFFCLALMCHVLLSVIKNARRPLKAKVKGALEALFMLQPAIESFNHWSGKPMDDDAIMTPVQILVGGRAIEIIFESLPEAIIQTGIAIEQPENASSLLYFSICSSIIAAAAIMTDTNIGYELAGMNSQERGRQSHPIRGLIPDGTAGLRMLYLGGVVFLAGYLGTNVVAITAFMLKHSSRWVLLYLAVEFAAVFLILVRTGRMYFDLSHGLADSFVQWFILYLMMQFVPFTNLRVPMVFGGAWFSRWIAWRLIANTAVFALVVKDNALWTYFGALLGAVVVGSGVVVYNVTDTHRWTLYQTRLSAKDHMMQCFNNQIEPESLETTLDGHRADSFVTTHPSYFDHQPVLNWLLSLEIDNALFAEGTKFGKTAGSESGKSYESWFGKVLTKIKFYNEREEKLVAKATAHIEVMRGELKQRSESIVQ